MTEQRIAYEFVETGGYIEGHRIESVDFSNFQEPGIRILDSQFSNFRFADTDFSSGQLTKVSFDGLDAPQWHLQDSGLQDLTVSHSRLGGVQAYATSWRRAKFEHSKIEFLNLRDSKLDQVTFADCTITELDLTGATVKNVNFSNCTIAKLIMTRTQCQAVDLRGAQFSSVTDFSGLRGTTMSLHQFIDLAPEFAAVMGVALK